jgi:hypothetical protein
MDEKLIRLIDDLRKLTNRAAALGVNIEPHTSAAARLLDAATEIETAFRRPLSDAVQ